MVAIVSGNSLGLDLTSKGTLGDQGVFGNAGMGAGGQQVYVNAANGNLVIQQPQDVLAGAGLDIDSVLTYNSQGLRTDDNGDNFSLGAVPVQLAITGTPDAAGSTLVRTGFDGSQATYTWDATNSRYVTTAGGGAYDTVTYSSTTTQYTWTDGTTGTTETYSAAGQLLSRQDLAGNKLTYTYTGNLLTKITDANGESVNYNYTGTQLTSITAPVATAMDDGATQSTNPVVTYGYDSSGRLSTVKIDLTPTVTTDSSVYTTTYTYDSSNRVASVVQSDGTSLAFQYDSSNRVQTITDALNNVTTFDYSQPNKTSVTTAGLKTTYQYDANGQLTSVTSPPPVSGGAASVTSFGYDASGNVTSTVDPDGNTTTMTYDASGNLLTTLNTAGDLVTRTYDAWNHLVSETTSVLDTPVMTSSTGVTLNGSTLTNTSGTTGQWSSAASSAVGDAGASAVSFSAAQTTAPLLVGLTTDPAANTSGAQIDWAFYCTSSGDLQVDENGVHTDLQVSYTTGDNLSVRYDGTQVTYLKNGQVLRSVVATITSPLYVAASFYTQGSSVKNLRFGSVASGVGDAVDEQAAPVLSTTAPGMTIQGDTVVKTATTSAWDSYVAGTTGIVGGASASFTVTSTNSAAMVGLTTSTAPTSFASLNFAAYANQFGQYLAYVNGSSVGTLGTLAVGDRLSVSYDGANTVTWLKNGQILLTQTYAQQTAPLYLGGAFYTPGASASNLRFGGAGAVDPIGKQSPPVMDNTANMSINGGTLTKTGGTDGAWDTSARSALSLSGGAEVGFTAATANKEILVGLNSDPDTDASYASIDYAFRLSGDGHVWAYASGVALQEFGTYAVGDRFVLRDNGSTITWLQNGQAICTTAATTSQPMFVDTSFATMGASVSNLTFDSPNAQAVAAAMPVPKLAGIVGVSSSSSGTLTKSTKTNAWDSSSRSANGIVGGATVSFSAVSTSDQVAVGLSTAPDSGVDYASIDYAFVLGAGNTLSAWTKGGQLVTLGTFAAHDRLSVSYDGVNVNWLQNGVVVHSVAASVTQPLYADTSFYTASSQIGSLRFGSNDLVDPLAAVDTPPLATATGVTQSGVDLVKTGNTDENWDTSTASDYSYADGASVSFTAQTPTKAVAVGLAKAPAAGASWTNIDYGFVLGSDGHVSVAEGGTMTALANVTYAAGDQFTVSYTGRQVLFVKNGQVLRADTVTLTQPLYAESAFRDLGAKVSDLAFNGPDSPDQTARYVYDTTNHGLLRFQISAAGRVTEYNYNAAGMLTSTNDYVAATFSTAGLAAGSVPTLQTMLNWRAMQDLTLTNRTDINRGTRGWITSTVAYAGATATGTGAGLATTTSYVHDLSGRLLQTSAAAAGSTSSATVTTYVYDGLGRVVSTTDAAGTTTTTSYAYAVVNGNTTSTTTITRTSSANAVVSTTTETLDAAGRVTGAVTSGLSLPTATTSTSFDAFGHPLRTVDADGNATYDLYDGEGRLVGQVDPTGVLTEYDYDSAGNVTRTITYATPINVALLQDSNHKPTNPPLASLGISPDPVHDQVSWKVYDADNRVLQTIDATGAVVRYDYDGSGNVIGTLAYATRVSTASLGTAPAAVSVASAAGDRLTRNFYDADGRLVGTLDADDYLTTYQYDGAGQETVTTRYANQVAASQMPATAATVDSLIPAPSLDDQRSVTLYDGAGRVTGQIDAAGTLTETVYDARGNVITRTRYLNPVGTDVAAGSTIDAIRPLTTTNDHTTKYTYDGANRVVQVTDDRGGVTTNVYDPNTEALQSSTDAQPNTSNALTTQTTYDAEGHVIATLSGNGGAAIAAGASTATAWATYGTTYAYDAGGRRIGMTDPRGNKTLYFYDADDRLRYTVDAMGDVQELRYDSFGDVIASVAYTQPLSATQLAGIGAGGAITANLTTAMTSLASSAITTAKSYQANGLVATTTDAATGDVTTDGYDAFGDLTSQSTTLLAGGTRVDTFGFDHRGNDTSSTLDQGGVDQSTSTAYDAFDRAVQQTDALGNVTTTTYDRLGEVTSRAAPLGAASTWIDDPFGEVTSESVAGGNPIVTSYSTSSRTSTTTTPTGVTTKTAQDYLGRTVSSTDGNGNTTTTTYDQDGNVTQITVGGVVTFVGVYDACDNLVASQDGVGAASGVWTHYTYDAANRLVYKVDPTGAVTYTQYDGAGRVTRTTRYATPISTSSLSNTSTSANVAALVVASPGFDAIDARVYDADGRVTWEVDGAGDVTHNTYGDNGTLVQRTRYATPLVLSSWTNTSAAPPVTASSKDQVERTVYDNLGRPTTSVDPAGHVTLTSYDADGNVTQTRQLATAIPSGGAMAVDQGTSAASEADCFLGTVAANDTITATVRYHGPATQTGVLKLGNAQPGSTWTTSSAVSADGWTTLTVVWTVTQAGSAYVVLGAQNFAAGSGTATFDDLTVTSATNGVMLSTSFDSITAGTGAGQWYGTNTTPRQTYVTPASAGSNASLQAFAQSLVGPNDQITRTVYDADGRAILTVDPSGAVSETAYDTHGNATTRRQLAATVQTAATLTDAQLLTLVSGLQNATNDRVTRTVYDASGRAVLNVDPMGYVTQTSYDGNGNVAELVRYAAALPPSQAGDTDAQLLAYVSTTLAGAGAGQVPPSLDQVTRYVFDADNRLVATVDPAGAITMTTRDASGNAIAVRQYATPLPASNTDSGAALLADLKAIATTASDRVTQNAYDGAGHLVMTQDPAGSVTSFAYDALGNVLSQTRYATPGAASLPSSIAGLATSAGDRTQTMSYDADGRLLWSVDARGYATNVVYDALGQVLSTTRYANAATPSSTPGGVPSVTPDSTHDLATSAIYDLDGHVVLSTDAMGYRTRNLYDAFGRLVYSVGPDGSITANQYRFDATGAVTVSTRYAHTIAATTLAAMTTAPDPSLVASLIVATPGGDAIDTSIYDAFGQLRFSVDGNGAVSERRYDLDGNVVDQITYANVLSSPNVTPGTTPSVVADPAHDRHVHSSYDAFGDVITQVTAQGLGSNGVLQGAVVANTYDLDGRLTDRVSYATLVALAGAWPSSPAPAVTAVIASDIHERFAYTAFGQIYRQADGAGDVTSYAYDAAGRMTQRTALYSQAATISVPLQSVNTNALDRTARFEYDAFGDQTWSSDAAGDVTSTTYDLGGNALVQRQYANAIPGAQPDSVTTSASDRVTTRFYDAFGRLSETVDPRGYVTTDSYYKSGLLQSETKYYDAVTLPVTSQPTPTPDTGGPNNTSRDETTSYVYDQVGNVLQRTDAMHGTQSWTYDGLGNKLTLTDERGQVWTYTYDADNRLLTQTSPTVTAVTNTVDWSPGNWPGIGSNNNVVRNTTTSDVVTTNQYDGTGNLISTTAAERDLNAQNAWQATSNTRRTGYNYDATGRRILEQPATFVYYDGQSGATGQVWQYTQYFYDAFGNLVATVDPQGNTTWSAYDQANRAVYTGNAVGKVTYNVYDTFGEVTSTTQYGTIQSVNASAPQQASSLASVATVASQVVANAGLDRTTTFAYDNAGRVLTKTGPAGTFFSYSNGAVATIGTAPMTSYRYDAFGDLVLQSAQTDGIAGSTTYATSYFYYDASGNQTASIDARGYMTTTQFDAFDNARQVVEYGHSVSGQSITNLPPPTTSSTDRTVTRTFDLLNRKTSETQASLVYNTTDDAASSGATTGTGVTSTWVYDAQGHVLKSTDGRGSVTYNEYDALGRLAATVSPTVTEGVVSVGSNGNATQNPVTLTAVTEFYYDVFGDQSLKIAYANSATSLATPGYTDVWTASSNSPTSSTSSTLSHAAYTVKTDPGVDRVTASAYDSAGHLIQVDDAMAHSTFYAYTMLGQLSRTWHVNAEGSALQVIFTNDVYNGAGQVLQERTAWVNPATYNGSKLQYVSTDYRYDVFGDLTGRGTNEHADAGTADYLYDARGLVVTTGNNSLKPTYQETFEYNANGQLWRTNQGDGVYHAYLHDLQGNVVADVMSAGSAFGNFDISTLTSEQQLAQALNTPATPNALNAGDLRTTYTQYDVLGRALNIFEPTRSSSSGTITPEISQSFDRWGNLLTRSDARNASWITTYTYNAANQVTQMVQPAANIVMANATTATSVAPTTQYFYDADGDLVATLDADGNVSGQRYDQAGHVVETDRHPTASTTVETTSSYDIFGRKVQDVAADAYATPPVSPYSAPGTTSPTLADYTTQYTYDADDDLTEVQHGIGAGSLDAYGSSQSYNGATQTGQGTAVDPADFYSYDTDGNRLSASNGWVQQTSSGPSTVKNLAYATTYTYDVAGHLASVTLPSVGGVASVTTTTYDDFGHETSETDANGKTALWQYNYFGNEIISHSDFGGTAYQYGYDNAGQLLTQTSSGGLTGGGQNLSYTYDAAGQQTQVVDGATNTTTTDAYDAAGNRVLERTTQGGVNYQNNTITYDALGRITDTNDGTAHVVYQYDAVGNRVEVTTTVAVSGSLTNNGTSTTETTGGWFTYDGMNRETGVDLAQPSGTPSSVIGSSGHLIAYDADGNRVSDEFYSTDKLTAQTINNLYQVVGSGDPIIGYDDYGDPIYGPASGGHNAFALSSGLVTETYTYDAGDRLSHSYRDGIFFDIELYDIDGRAVTEGPAPDAPNSLPQGTSTDTDAYIADFFQAIRINSYNINVPVTSNKDTLDASTRSYVYDAQGRLASESFSTPGGNGEDISYAAHWGSAGQDRGYDAAGNLLGTETVTANVTNATTHPGGGGEPDPYTITTTTTVDETFTLVAGETYESTLDTKNQTIVTVNTNPSTPSTTTTSNSQAIQSNYDADGHVANISVQSSSGVGTPDTTYVPRQFVYADNGQVLAETAPVGTMSNGTSNLQSRNLLVDGQLLGIYGVVFDTAPSGGTSPQDIDEFDNGYRALNDNSSNASVGSYVVHAGDTLQSIAETAYGDSTLWKRIAQANGIDSDDELHAGMSIRLPSTTILGGGGDVDNGAEQMLQSDDPSLPVPVVHAMRAIPTVRNFGANAGGADAMYQGTDMDSVDGMTSDAENNLVTTVTNGDGTTSVYLGNNQVTAGVDENGNLTLNVQGQSLGADATVAGLTASDVASMAVPSVDTSFTQDAPGESENLRQSEITDENHEAKVVDNALFGSSGFPSGSMSLHTDLPSLPSDLQTAFAGAGFTTPADAVSTESDIARDWVTTGSPMGSFGVPGLQNLTGANNTVQFGNAADTSPASDSSDDALGNVTNQNQGDADAQAAEAIREANRETVGTQQNAGRVVTIGPKTPDLSHAIGSSSPQAIGNAAVANGLQSSLVFPGQNIFVPADPTLNGNQTALGQSILNADNKSRWSGEELNMEGERAQFLADANQYTTQQSASTDSNQIHITQIGDFQDHPQQQSILRTFFQYLQIPDELATLAGNAIDGGQHSDGQPSGKDLVNMGVFFLTEGASELSQLSQSIKITDQVVTADSAATLGNVGSREPMVTLEAGADADEEPFTTFFHGTTAENASKIRAGGIDLSVGNPAADFGQGFYMSTSPEDALWSAGRNAGGAPTELIEFRVPNSQLDSLSSLTFGDAGAEWQDFVSFHKGLDYDAPSEWMHGGEPYDMVTGPLFRRVNSDGVPIQWPGVSPQTSIHTPTAADLFNTYMVGHP